MLLALTHFPWSSQLSLKSVTRVPSLFCGILMPSVLVVLLRCHDLSISLRTTLLPGLHISCRLSTPRFPL